MSDRVDGLRSRWFLLRHRQGDRAALTGLVSLWERALFYYLRRLLDSEEDAWDALQETWLLVVRGLPRLRDDAAFPAWAYTIARRVAFRTRQRSPATQQLPDDDHPDAPASGEPEPSLAEFDPLDIHRGLARLGLAHRDVLTLHVLEGFSIAEIAAITGVVEGTVKSRLFHAKRAMRTMLEGGPS
jgi:RNA polymerase sigma-70 factor (ECF subfamily)